jgi:hypothetical protein
MVVPSDFMKVLAGTGLSPMELGLPAIRTKSFGTAVTGIILLVP